MFPTGAYAHSFGLEGLVEQGIVKDEATLLDYLSGAVLPSLSAVDLPLVHAAWQAAAQNDVERLLDLDDLANALRPTRELRDASRRTGSQRLHTLRQLRPHDLLASFVERGGEGHAPVVFGMETALWEVPERSALQAFVYQAVSGQITAAVKLIAIGQMTVQRIITELAAEMEERIDAAMVTTPEDAGWFSPLPDIASARHERAYTRLFIS
jgi:urease accessory protein